MVPSSQTQISISPFFEKVVCRIAVVNLGCDKTLKRT